jgi:hypothetical protein
LIFHIGDCTSDSDNDGICDLQLCIEDLNTDGFISVQDILILHGAFGCNVQCEYDINQGCGNCCLDPLACNDIPDANTDEEGSCDYSYRVWT